MLERLSKLPNQALHCEARRLERRLIEGVADGPEIDAYVAFESELGRRWLLAIELPDALDGLLDPRD